MNTEIYYFSGTGNSLFLAKEVQKRIPDSEILPIACLLNKDKIISGAKIIGFVFPVHALTIPLALMKFLRKFNCSGAEYIFAIADRHGTVFYGFKKIDRLLKKHGKSLDAQFVIDMCNNESRHPDYQVPSEEEIEACERAALKKLDTAAEIILKRGRHEYNIKDYPIPTASNPISAFIIEKLVLALMGIAEHTRGVNYFYHDERCTGCGICEKVCLSGKLSIDSGKPIWKKEVSCYMCFACLNFCPVKAVQIRDIPGVKSYTKENGRYPHPYASIGDMQKQKGD